MMKSTNSTASQSELALKNFDDFAESLCDSLLDIQIEFDAETSHDPVCFELSLNNVILTQRQIVTGSHQVNSQTHLALSCSNRLCLSMTNKSALDTVIENGVIVADTYIKLTAFSINRFNVLTDYDFFANQFRAVDADNIDQNPKPGFWNNSSLLLDFSMPFELWYQIKSNKNVKVSDSLKHQTSSELVYARDLFKKSINLLDT